MTLDAVVSMFTAAMEAFAPFENAPHLGVALSGGADSMSLCLLARDWAAGRGGRVTALTVDHRLRPASAEEAEHVAALMARHGIEHRILRWLGEYPTNALQEKARIARYRLLCRWCLDNSVLHLLLGHHAEDQAETILQRLVRGSGSDGLAGMSALVETAHVRLLRPLLDCRSNDLRCFLRRRGEVWVEDPSNRDPRFARTRLRASSTALNAAGLGQAVLFAAARRSAAAKAAMQQAVMALLAKCCRVHPLGFARLERMAMAAAPIEIGAKALARVVTMIGGSANECSVDRARRCYQKLFGGPDRRTRTLGRCLLVDQGSDLLVCRERRNLPPPQILCSPGEILWDGRFRLRVRLPGGAAGSWYVRPLSEEDWRILRSAPTKLRDQPSLPLVCGTLPVLCDEGGLAIAPQLWYAREDLVGLLSLVVEVVWRPRNGITGGGYFLL